MTLAILHHRIRGLAHASVALGLLWASAAPAGAQALPSDAQFRTHAERSGWTELTPHEAVVDFYRELAAAFPGEVRLREIGRSREGRPLLGLTLASPAVSGPQEAHASGKPIIFIGAQVHGNEPAGKEGLMLFARSLLMGENRALIENGIFVLVPQINPDAAEAGPSGTGTRANAAGYNVNRDYARLVNPEAQAVVQQILTPWRPHVIVDAHEVSGAHAYDFYALHPSHLGTPSPVLAMSAGPAIQAVRDAIEGSGRSYFPYHLLPSDPTRIPEEGILGAGYGVRILRSYGGVRGAVSLLYESRRGDDPREGMEARARDQATAMAGLARWAVTEREQVLQTVAAGREENRRLGGTWDPEDRIVVRATLGVSGVVPYRTPEMVRRADGSGFERTGRILDLEVPFRNLIVPVVERPRPVGYLLEAHRGDLAQALMDHGLDVEWMAGPFTHDVERLVVDSIQVAAIAVEGYFERTVWTTPTPGSQTFPRGAYLIRATQSMAGLAMALLEPEDEDSFASAGLFSAEKRVGTPLPVYRLRTLPRGVPFLLSATREQP
jgi:hypothetical protein